MPVVFANLGKPACSWIFVCLVHLEAVEHGQSSKAPMFARGYLVKLSPKLCLSWSQRCQFLANA